MLLFSSTNSWDADGNDCSQYENSNGSSAGIAACSQVTNSNDYRYSHSSRQQRHTTSAPPIAAVTGFNCLYAASLGTTSLKRLAECMYLCCSACLSERNFSGWRRSEVKEKGQWQADVPCPQVLD